MRRLISYITLSSAILLGAGVAVTPTIINMNTDSAYRDAKAFTFRVSHQVESASGDYQEYNPGSAKDNGMLIEEDDKIITEVTETFIERLDNWGLSSYSIESIGYDTIKVTLRANDDNSLEYDYLKNYLTFSGENFELDASDTTHSDYPDKDSLKYCLDYDNAWIEYIEQGGVSSFPVVVVPLEDTTGTYDETTLYEDFLSLIDYCNANTTEANEDEGTSAETCALVLWANRKSTDKYEDASKDQNVASRIINAEATTNDSAVYYDDDDDDKETPYVQFIPQSDAISDGSYNAEHASEAYLAAKYLNHLLHASKYNVNGEDVLVNYLFQEDVSASVEELFSYYWDQNLSFSRTLIASIVAFVLVAVVLVIFEKLFALQIVSIAVGTVYLTLGAFVMFGAQFNIAALFGLLFVAMLSIFQGITYTNRVKDELYKGRTIKKAHQEGVKKSTMLTVDSSVVSIVLGIFIFFFSGDIAAKAGTMLTLGGFISLVISSLFNRILGWMISTDSEAQSKFAKWFNIDTTKIPDPLKEEKQTYFGSYENKNFSKGKKAILGLTGLFTLAGIVAMTIFGTINGNVFNTSAYTEPQTVVYVEVKSTSTTENTSKLDAVTCFVDENDDSAILNTIKINEEKTLADVATVTLADTFYTYYDAEEEMSSSFYYFTIALDGDYSDTTFTVGSTSDYSLEDALDEAIEAYGLSSNTYCLSVKELVPSYSTPSVGRLYLGLGIGIAVVALYFVCRFGFGRGLTASIFACATSFVSTSFFVFARISVTPIVSIGAIGSGLITLLAAVAIFNKHNELVKAAKEKDKETIEDKNKLLLLSTNRAAGELIVFSLLVAYALVSYFAFGPSTYGSVYLNAIIGLVFAVGLALSSLAPVSAWANTLFSKIKIKLPEKKKKKLGQLSSNKNSSEPEEAIFIGIND